MKQWSGLTRLVLGLALGGWLVSAPGCSSSDGNSVLQDLGTQADQQTATADAGVPKTDGDAQQGQKDAGVQPVLDSAPQPKPDSAPQPKPDSAQPLPPDSGLPITPDIGTLPPLDPLKVAALQYGEGQSAQVSAYCASTNMPDFCAVKTMVSSARLAGAALIVAPEYALGQTYYEPDPKVGDNPGTNAGWPAVAMIKAFSQQAKQLQVHLVVDLLTYTGSSPNATYYNTQVVFGPDGAVKATHHKFNLFGSEPQSLTAGSDVSVIDTPVGKLGFLICADIYGSASLLDKLANTLKARVVAVSSYWTVANSVSWYSSYAQKYGMYTIASNTTHSPGAGGGIYAPNGAALAEKIQTKPSIVYATLPAP